MEIIRVAASANAVNSLAPNTIVYGAILTAAAADASVLIYDALTAAGTDKLSLATLAKTSSQQVCIDDGVQFKKGISVTITGAGAVLYLIIG